MGLYTNNIQIKIDKDFDLFPKSFETICAENLPSKDDFEKTDELDNAFFYYSISPRRETGWRTIKCSQVDAYAIGDTIEFVKYLTSFLRSIAAINMVFDSDDAISIIIEDGRIIGAFSNKKKNISRVAVEGNTIVSEGLNAIWKKREKFKEQLIESTASYFGDVPDAWLKNKIEDNYLTLSYRHKFHSSQFAESTADPSLVWAGSENHKESQGNVFKIAESFSNRGGCFQGILVALTSKNIDSNSGSVEDATLTDDLSRETYSPSKMRKQSNTIELEFGDISIAGCVNEIISLYAKSQFPSIMAIDYMSLQTIKDNNGRVIGSAIQTGRKYTFRATLNSTEKKEDCQILFAILGSNTQHEGLRYSVGNQPVAEQMSIEAISKQIKDGIEPVPSIREKMEIIKRSHPYLIEKFGFDRYL